MSGAPPLLEVKGLNKAFGGIVAARDLHFSVAEGEIMGLIGPNGSGKTTVINLLSGELGADAGEIRLKGRDIAGLSPHRICRERVSRTFQLVRIMPGMTVAENVMLAGMFGSRRAAVGTAHAAALELVERVGLADKADTPASVLTYIDQKRVELARALATGPMLLLLDEWLAGLNPAELEIGMDLVARTRADGMSVILVEHVMHAVRKLSDRIVVMNAGVKVIEGGPEEVLSHPEVVRVYLGGDRDA